MNAALQSINTGFLATLPAIALMTATIPAQAQSAITPLPPTATVDGKTQAQLSAEWWQVALGLPVDQNPILDPTGANAKFGQSGSVLFLFGTLTGEPVTRQITVRDDQFLFFPLFNGAYITTPDDPPLTEADIRGLVAEPVNRVTSLNASVNGVAIANLFNYRQFSPVFDITLPENNVFGAPAGVYGPSVSDGYWLLLPPLPVGNYNIQFGSTSVNADGSLFQQSNTYQVEAVPEPTTILGLLAGGIFGVVAKKRRQLQD